MKFLCLLICSVLLLGVTTNAQNLINNPGFEDYYNYLDCNTNLVYKPNYWHYGSNVINHPVYYSTDRFLNKSLPPSFHPNAKRIMQGEKINYISVLVLPSPQKAFTELKEPLQKGERYQIHIDVKAFDQSSCLSDLLVGFKDSLTNNADTCLYQINLPIPDSLCNDSLYDRWITLTTDFTAVGNERVLVLNSGSKEDYSKIIALNIPKYMIRYAQGPFKLKYFIDNINLTAIESSTDSLFTARYNSLDIGETIILQNIYFAFDEFTLLKESFPALNKVAEYLEKHSKVRILITGHTDNIGSDEYNYELSARRANSVVAYLIEKGIAVERLQWEGIGKNAPITTNDTEEGRGKNRRIEMKVLSK